MDSERRMTWSEQEIEQEYVFVNGTYIKIGETDMQWE